jgi:L-asparaginase
MKPRNILVIYTGGTFGMSETLEIEKLSSQALQSGLEQGVPEMSRIANCEVEVAFNTDSCQMGMSHWVDLARRISRRSGEFDGVVVLHGTDTLAYTAVALSYLLSPSPIPIVLTGAQKPLSSLRNDARTNLLTALEVAADAPKELRDRVMVAFHDGLFLGSRVRKQSAIRFAAFESPRFPALARVGSNIQYRNSVFHLPPLAKTGGFPGLPEGTGFPPASLVKMSVTPDFPGAFFESGWLQSADGILLTLYTSGTAPTEQHGFLEFLSRAEACSLPVYAITESSDAPIHLASYSAGKALSRHGVLWCHDLTPEAAFVKARLLQLRERQMAGRSRNDFYSWLRENWDRPLSDESSGQ